jgi:hypothetical protein
MHFYHAFPAVPLFVSLSAGGVVCAIVALFALEFVRMTLFARKLPPGSSDVDQKAARVDCIIMPCMPCSVRLDAATLVSAVFTQIALESVRVAHFELKLTERSPVFPVDLVAAL